MKIATLVQARMGSTRLPGKVLKEILGESLLFRQLERMRQAKLAGTIQVIMSDQAYDDVLAEYCNNKKINYFRGSEQDLLDRHYQAAKLLEADAVVKIPSDCPLIDPVIIDEVISFFLENSFDYVSNLHPASWPDGNDVEIMRMATLEQAWKEAVRPLEREHTTPFIWEHPEKFNIGNVRWNTGQDFSQSHRFTIDYEEDFLFIKAVFENLYPKNSAFTLEDILQLLNEKPELMALNAKYAGHYWYMNHLTELTQIDKEKYQTS